LKPLTKVIISCSFRLFFFYNRGFSFKLFKFANAIFVVSDKKTIFEENLNKKPCHKYLSSGSCPFGNNCKYRHLSEKDLAKLKAEVGKLHIIKIFVLCPFSA